MSKLKQIIFTCRTMEADIEAKLRDRYTLIDKTDPEQIREAQARGININDDGTVGEPDGSGFAVGVDPSSSKAPYINAAGGRGPKSTKKKGKERQRYAVN